MRKKEKDRKRNSEHHKRRNPKKPFFDSHLFATFGTSASNL